MNELRKLLDDKFCWLMTTKDAEHVSVKLDAKDLARIIKAVDCLDAWDKPVAELPKIEPRLLHPQEPRGTRRSPEEIARVLAERYGQTEEIKRKVLQSCA